MWLKTREDVAGALRRFKTHTKSELYIMDGNRQGELKLFAGHDVCDRQTDEPTYLSHGRVFNYPLTTQHLAAHVRALLVAFAVHEVDEMLTYHGNRLFDPHDPKKCVRRTVIVDGQTQVDE